VRSSVALALAFVLAAGWPIARAVATDDAIYALPLVAHVPGGEPSEHARGLLETLREAYAPHGICFEVSFRSLPEERRVLHTIPDRRSLSRLFAPRTLNAFFVDRAHDPNPSESTVRTAARAGFEPTGLLGGAHIPARGHRPGTYVIVTRDSSRFALAHEVGPFLGAPHHPDPTNIMSYGRDRRVFDPEQVRVFRARARRYLHRRELDRATCSVDST
jgi:hypothetical protein